MTKDINRKATGKQSQTATDDERLAASLIVEPKLQKPRVIMQNLSAQVEARTFSTIGRSTN